MSDKRTKTDELAAMARSLDALTEIVDSAAEAHQGALLDLKCAIDHVDLSVCLDVKDVVQALDRVAVALEDGREPEVLLKGALAFYGVVLEDHPNKDQLQAAFKLAWNVFYGDGSPGGMPLSLAIRWMQGPVVSKLIGCE